MQIAVLGGRIRLVVGRVDEEVDVRNGHPVSERLDELVIERQRDWDVTATRSLRQ